MGPWAPTTRYAWAANRLWLTLMLGGPLIVHGMGCAPPPPQERANSHSEVGASSASRPEAPGRRARPTLQEPDTTADLDAITASTKAEQLSHWSAVHAFIGSEVVAGRALGGEEAIALTQDNLVGLTEDMGASWRFSHPGVDDALAVGGREGGPYVAVGVGGAIVVSAKGAEWRPLPRYTGDDLIAVAVLGDTALALGAKGTVVRAALDGSAGHTSRLPGGFIPSSIVTHSGQLLAINGSKALQSLDGVQWTPALPSTVNGAHDAPATSLGHCKLGRVGLRRGLLCSLSGVAHGVGDVTFVDTQGGIAMSEDRGERWRHAALAIASVHRVFGFKGGPYFAVGAQGGLARSAEGRAWSTRTLTTTRTLRDGLVNDGVVLIVGDMGTIVRSEDRGETWVVVPTGLGATLETVTSRDGALVASGAEISLESRDQGKTWRKRSTVSPGFNPSKRAPCDGRLPADGELCLISRHHPSPLGLPNMTGFHFDEDAGLAFGELGLVAFTPDGGRTWRTNHGMRLSRIDRFEVVGNVIVALNRSSVTVSSDGGAHFHSPTLPSAMIGGFLDAHITASGTVYVSGKKGFIVKSEGTLEQWLPLNTGERSTAQFQRLFEVDGNLYAAGKRGGLLRTANEGASWQPVPLGLNGQIAALSGRGDSVMALMTGTHDGGWLLSSNDAGAHFATRRALHVLTERELVNDGDFHWDGERLEWAGKSSEDGGRTWRRHPGWLPASQDLGDGFTASARNGRLIVKGPTEGDEVEVILPINTSRLTCEGGRPCWLINGGQVYRSRARM